MFPEYDECVIRYRKLEFSNSLLNTLRLQFTYQYGPVCIANEDKVLSLLLKYLVRCLIKAPETVHNFDLNNQRFVS